MGELKLELKDALLLRIDPAWDEFSLVGGNEVDTQLTRLEILEMHMVL